MLFPCLSTTIMSPFYFFPSALYCNKALPQCRVSLGKHLQRRCGGGERYVYACTYIHLRRTQWPRRMQTRDVRSEGFSSPSVPPYPRRKGALSPGALPQCRRPGLAEPGGRVLPPGVSALLPVWVTFVEGGTDPALLLRGSKSPWQILLAFLHIMNPPSKR